MNCRRIEPNLILFMEGSLGPDETREVEAHLSECPACAREKARLESVLGLLGRSRIADVDTDEGRFIAMVHEKAAAQGKKPQPRLGLAAVALAAFLLVAGAAVGVVVLYRSTEPVATVGQAGEWDDQCVQGPSVVWNPDLSLYQMWYDGRRGTNRYIAAVGYATSPDGMTWTKYDGNPVIPADARWPCVLYEPEDTNVPYKVWFNVGPGDYIAYARSQDGTKWTDIETVLKMGPPGSYDDSNVAAPCVVKVNGEYWMYYDAGTSKIAPPIKWGHYIALATSGDGVHWTRRQIVLRLGAPGSWECGRVYNVQVVYRDGLFEMWYTGAAGRGQAGDSRNIGYARSQDGLAWTKSPHNPVVWGVQAPKAYDASVGPPGVLKTEEGYKVWFTAIPASGAGPWQIGYAEYALDAFDWTQSK